MSVSVSSSLWSLILRRETHTRSISISFRLVMKCRVFSSLWEFGAFHLFWTTADGFLLLQTSGSTFLRLRSWSTHSPRLQLTPEELFSHQDPWKRGSLESLQEDSVPGMLLSLGTTDRQGCANKRSDSCCRFGICLGDDTDPSQGGASQQSVELSVIVWETALSMWGCHEPITSRSVLVSEQIHVMLRKKGLFFAVPHRAQISAEPCSQVLGTPCHPQPSCLR